LKKRFGKGELDRAFHVLFDKQAHWQWPFLGDDLSDVVLDLGCSAFWLALIIGIFTKFSMNPRNLVFLAIAILIYRTVRLNSTFIANAQIRRRYRRRYISVVEHTDAYALLEEALDQRRKGVVRGLGSKKETEEALLRLWRTAFAEADKLALVTTSGADLLTGDPLDERPISDQIQQYMRSRTEAYEELDSVQTEINRTSQ